MKDRFTDNNNEWPDTELEVSALSFAVSMVMIVMLIIIAIVA